MNPKDEIENPPDQIHSDQINREAPNQSLLRVLLVGLPGIRQNANGIFKEYSVENFLKIWFETIAIPIGQAMRSYTSHNSSSAFV
jgi:hypothetical protein